MNIPRRELYSSWRSALLVEEIWILEKTSVFHLLLALSTKDWKLVCSGISLSRFWQALVEEMYDIPIRDVTLEFGKVKTPPRRSVPETELVVS